MRMICLLSALMICSKISFGWSESFRIEKVIETAVPGSRPFDWQWEDGQRVRQFGSPPPHLLFSSSHEAKSKTRIRGVRNGSDFHISIQTSASTPAGLDLAAPAKPQNLVILSGPHEKLHFSFEYWTSSNSVPAVRAILRNNAESFAFEPETPCVKSEKSFIEDGKVIIEYIMPSSEKWSKFSSLIRVDRAKVSFWLNVFAWRTKEEPFLVRNIRIAPASK
jgi:hypothetical protein